MQLYSLYCIGYTVYPQKLRGPISTGVEVDSLGMNLAFVKCSNDSAYDNFLLGHHMIVNHDTLKY